MKPVLDPRWQWHRFKGRLLNNPYWYEDYFSTICGHPLDARFVDLMSGFEFCVECGLVIELVEQSSAKVPSIVSEVTVDWSIDADI